MKKIYCIYDKASKTFSGVTADYNEQTITRGLTDVVNNNNSTSLFNLHPQDFELICLGDFDDETGAIIPHVEKVLDIEKLVHLPKEV